MKTLLILGTLLTAPAFAGGSNSSSGSITPDGENQFVAASLGLPPPYSAEAEQDMATLLARREALLTQLADVEAENANLEQQIEEKGAVPEEDDNTGESACAPEFAQDTWGTSTRATTGNNMDVGVPDEALLSRLQNRIHRAYLRGNRLTEQLLLIAQQQQARLKKNARGEIKKAVKKVKKVEKKAKKVEEKAKKVEEKAKKVEGKAKKVEGKAKQLVANIFDGKKKKKKKKKFKL